MVTSLPTPTHTGLKASLERLQLEYVDVVFANRPDPNTPMEGKLGPCWLCSGRWKVLGPTKALLVALGSQVGVGRAGQALLQGAPTPPHAGHIPAESPPCSGSTPGPLASSSLSRLCGTFFFSFT